MNVPQLPLKPDDLSAVQSLVMTEVGVVMHDYPHVDKKYATLRAYERVAALFEPPMTGDQLAEWAGKTMSELSRTNKVSASVPVTPRIGKIEDVPLPTRQSLKDRWGEALALLSLLKANQQFPVTGLDAKSAGSLRSAVYHHAKTSRYSSQGLRVRVVRDKSDPTKYIVKKLSLR